MPKQPETVVFHKPKQPETKPTLFRGSPFSVVQEGEEMEFPGDNPSDGIELLQKTLSRKISDLRDAMGLLIKEGDKGRAYRARIGRYEGEGKAELVAKNKATLNLTHAKIDGLKTQVDELEDEIKALQEQIRVQKKYA